MGDRAYSDLLSMRCVTLCLNMQGRSQKEIMTEAMSMKNMTEAIGPFFSWVFMVFMMSINNKNDRND